MDTSGGKTVKLIIGLLVLVVLGWFFYSISETLTILIISFLVAYILEPLVSSLEYRGMARTQAVLIIFVVIGIFVAGLIAIVIPPLVNELKTIEHGLSSGSSAAYFSKMETWLHDQIPFIDPNTMHLQEKVTHALSGLTQSMFSIIGSVVSIVTTLIIIPFAVFFFLKDGRDMKKAIVSMIPNRYFEMSLNLIHKTDEQLGSYLRGQFFDALIIGFLSIIALWILNVPYFILIGVFAGLANMIPYVGPLTGAVTAIIVVMISGGSGQQMLLVAGAFAVIQLMDNVLVQPLVVAKTVNLHPLLIIFVVIIGGQFFGILGMLLAVPVTGMLKVLIAESMNSMRRYNIV